MDAVGMSVEFDGAHLIAVPTNAVGRLAIGGPLTVAVEDIEIATLRPAGSLRNGHVDLLLRDGRRHRIEFTRVAQEQFSLLHEELLNARVPCGAGPLRGCGYFRQEVVADHHGFRGLRALVGPEPTGERQAVALLERDAGDPAVVRVLVEGQVVGFLPRADAVAYRAPLDQVGGAGTCRARLWWTADGDDFVAAVFLDLAEPGFLVPVNAVAESPSRLHVPPGRAYRLCRTGEHLDAVAPLLDRTAVPGRALVIASLHALDPAPRARGIVVRVDGKDIGELGRQTASRLLPLVAPLAAVGVTCYADARLVGNALAVEGRVVVTPPEELAPEFIARVRDLLARSR